jgi:hypothetical protein
MLQTPLAETDWLVAFDGVSLIDTHGLMEGEGKKARTMRITSLDLN